MRDFPAAFQAGHVVPHRPGIVPAPIAPAAGKRGPRVRAIEQKIDDGAPDAAAGNHLRRRPFCRTRRVGYAVIKMTGLPASAGSRSTRMESSAINRARSVLFSG
jgi:hypothetical protein